MPQPLRNTGEMLSGGYRYSFNGMEKDDELYGVGNSYDFGARIYNPRLGRWMSRDPYEMRYISQTTYGACLNNPIAFIDPNGKEVIIPRNPDGTPAFTHEMTEAIKIFIATPEGEAFIRMYLKKDEEFFGIVGTEDGILSSQQLYIEEFHVEGISDGSTNSSTGPVIIKITNPDGSTAEREMDTFYRYNSTLSKAGFKNKVWNTISSQVVTSSVTITINTSNTDINGDIKYPGWTEEQRINSFALTLGHEVFIHVENAHAIIQLGIVLGDFDMIYDGLKSSYENGYGAECGHHQGYQEGHEDFELFRNYIKSMEAMDRARTGVSKTHHDNNNRSVEHKNKYIPVAPETRSKYEKQKHAGRQKHAASEPK